MGEKAGRPPFVPTAKQRADVELCIACGMSQVNTARALGIAKDTLEKHFADEIAYGPARQHLRAINLLMASAEKGNVSAQKKLAEMTAVRTSAADMRDWIEKPEQPKIVGKKEAVLAAARAATEDTDSEWGSDLRFRGNQPMN